MLVAEVDKSRRLHFNCALYRTDYGAVHREGAQMVISGYQSTSAEARNDIGLAIMSQFHYGPQLRIVNVGQVGGGK